MKIITEILVAIAALEHLYILWMEMFSWETVGKRVFKKSLPEELFKQTKGLAANQGLYNGFLAAGLIWSFFITNLAWKENVALFFLSCIAIAGIYGALSADKKIFFIQSLPAILAMALLLIY